MFILTDNGISRELDSYSERMHSQLLSTTEEENECIPEAHTFLNDFDHATVARAMPMGVVEDQKLLYQNISQSCTQFDALYHACILCKFTHISKSWTLAQSWATLSENVEPVDISCTGCAVCGMGKRWLRYWPVNTSFIAKLDCVN